MADWGLFFGFALVLTALLLALARRSQATLKRATDPADPVTNPDRPAPEGATLSSNDAGVGHPEGPVPPEAEPDVQLTTGALLVNVGTTQGLVALALVGAAWAFSIPASAFGVTDDAMGLGVTGVAVGLAFGVVLWLSNELSTTVADAVGATHDEQVRGLLAPDSPGGWAALLGVVLPLIALGEELLFRAALIGVPAAGFDVSPWLLAVLSSLAFALGHGAQGRVGILVTGVLGFVLAAGYILTGSLLVVVVAHYVINAAEFLVHEYLGVDGLLPFAIPARHLGTD